MSWRKWLPQYEVPRKVDRLVSAGILKDKTSRRDIVPHFETVLHDGSDVVLWVDHPSPHRRAQDDGPRYGIEIFQKEDVYGVLVTTPKTVFGSNNLDETLHKLQEILQRHGLV